MEIAEITKVAGRHKRRRRIGRGPGSGKGKTCGRGHKGAGSRAGWTRRGLSEGGQMPSFRRLPKRGFSNFNYRTTYSVVNVGDLDQRFEAGTHITPELLAEAGLIRGLRQNVKILGDGSLSKKLTVDAKKFSKQAAEKIKAAGGEVNLI